VGNLKYRYEYDDRAIPYPKLSCDHHAALLVSVIVAEDYGKILRIAQLYQRYNV